MKQVLVKQVYGKATQIYVKSSTENIDKFKEEGFSIAATDKLEDYTLIKAWVEYGN